MSPWSFPEPPPACGVAACVWPGSLFFRPPACERSGPMCELSMTVVPVVEVEAVVDAAEASLRGLRKTGLLALRPRGTHRVRSRACLEGPSRPRPIRKGPSRVSPTKISAHQPSRCRAATRCGKPPPTTLASKPTNPPRPNQHDVAQRRDAENRPRPPQALTTSQQRPRRQPPRTCGARRR